jgi:D-3-phosphoglycerate dehydrogenase
MPKVLITPRSFAQYSDGPFKKLESAGISIVNNPAGNIMTKGQMIEHIKGMDGIILGVDPMDADVLAAASDLKVVSKYGVGTDNIDLGYCAENGIEVTITKNANSEAVADYAFALMLSVARKVVEIDKGCRNGDWGKKVAVDVYGKKIGIIGLGAIGRGVAARAKGFCMELYGYDAFPDDDYMKANGITAASPDEMLKECDFISLHLPLTADTKHMINAKNLATAKKNLIIINTARGGIINEDDLYEALKNGAIMGAGVDVFESEPAKNSRLLELDNTVVGSHCGASTIGAVDTMSMMAAENVINVFRKKGMI